MAIRAEELQVGRIIHWVSVDPESKYLIVGKGTKAGRWDLQYILTGDTHKNHPVELYLDQIHKVISNKKKVFK